MSRVNILVIDDDQQICELLQGYLQRQDFNVFYQHDGRDVLSVLGEKKIDLVILDLMLPGEDGLSICQKIRQHSAVMIIMLTAVGEETDRIVGIEMGADDYLAKPFNPRELLARIKALIRRTSGELGQQRQQQQFAKVTNLYFADWMLDRNKCQLVSPEKIVIPLTQGEYALLTVLLEHANQVLSRDQLLSVIHNREAGPFDRTIDVQIARLRKKIESDAKNPHYIKTIRGGGYQFIAKVTYG